jgi:predicted nucleic acid-binding protein
LITHLLDTSALLAHYRKQSGWKEVNRLLADEALAPAVCVVSIAELGVLLRQLGLPEGARAQTLRDYLAIMTTALPVTESVASTALDIRLGSPVWLPTTDALVVAMAREERAVLVHRNQRMADLARDVVAQVNLFNC